jgi:hypothetical protein
MGRFHVSNAFFSVATLFEPKKELTTCLLKKRIESRAKKGGAKR